MLQPAKTLGAICPDLKARIARVDAYITALVDRHGLEACQDVLPALWYRKDDLVSRAVAKALSLDIS